MQIILIIVGGFIGLWLAEASDELLGIGLGAGIGYLLSRIRALNLQLRRLDDRI